MLLPSMPRGAVLKILSNCFGRQQTRSYKGKAGFRQPQSRGALTHRALCCRIHGIFGVWDANPEQHEGSASASIRLENSHFFLLYNTVRGWKL